MVVDESLFLTSVANDLTNVRRRIQSPKIDRTGQNVLGQGLKVIVLAFVAFYSLKLHSAL